MNRRYTVLQQFQLDLSRLIHSIRTESVRLPPGDPSSEEVMRIFRPVHSLKGLCAMVDEGKDLAKIFHVLEDTLSELLTAAQTSKKKVSGWRELVARAVDFAQGTQTFVDQKLKLWERFGAHEDESRGLVVALGLEGRERRLWLPITSLSGQFPAASARKLPEGWTQIGQTAFATEALLVEFPGASVLVNALSIVAIATRDEAVDHGATSSLKDYLTDVYRRVA